MIKIVRCPSCGSTAVRFVTRPWASMEGSINEKGWLVLGEPTVNYERDDDVWAECQDCMESSEEIHDFVGEPIDEEEGEDL